MILFLTIHGGSLLHFRYLTPLSELCVNIVAAFPDVLVQPARIACKQCLGYHWALESL